MDDKLNETVRMKIVRIETTQKYLCRKVDKIEKWVVRGVFALIATAAGVIWDAFFTGMS